MLENTPWPSKRVELSSKHRKKSGKQATGAAAPATPSASGDSACAEAFPVELRWGVQPADLRALWALHEKCFPVAYDLAYYRFLLEPQCLSLTAYTTPAALERLQAKASAPGGAEAVEGAAKESDAESESSVQEVSATIAAAEARMRGDHLLSGTGTLEQDTRTMAEVDQFITEVEYQALRDASKAKATAETSAAPSDCTEVVGFICGNIAFARNRHDSLFTNPTGYIGSVAVLPAARRLGVGAQLLDALLEYLTTQLPLHASYYLHYEEREMRDMAWRLVRKEQEKKKQQLEADAVAAQRKQDAQNETLSEAEKEERAKAAAAAVRQQHAAAKEAELKQREYSFWETMAQFFFPELITWMERRQVRKQLLDSGMTPDEVDDEIARRVQEADSKTADELAEDEYFTTMPVERRKSLLDPVVQMGVREVWLHCLADDVPLQRFYKNKGFSVAMERVPAYYDFNGSSHDASVLLYVKGRGVEAAAVAEMEAARAMDAAKGIATGVPVTPEGVMEDLAQVAERRRQEMLARRESMRAKQAQLAAKEASQLQEEKEGSKDAPTLRRRHTSKPENTATPPPQPPTDEKKKGDDGGSAASEGTSAGAEKLDATAHSSQWLSHATYADVTAIEVSSVSAARREWDAKWGPQRARLRARRMQERPASWKDHIKEMLFTLNALLALCAVVYMWYNYGAQ